VEAAIVTPARRSGARRTQQERREATVGKLLDATIEALADVGYARTSVSEICSRAGVSHGAVFCHFDSRLELIAAAAEEIGRRQVASVRAEFGSTSQGGDTDILTRVIRFMDAAARSKTNAVLLELLVVSRTDDGLRPAIRRVMTGYMEQIEAAAAELFERDEYDPRVFRSAVWGLISLFSGLVLTDPLELGESTPRSDIVRLAPKISRLVLNGMIEGKESAPKARPGTRRGTGAVASGNAGASARKATGRSRRTKRKGPSLQ
jgi:AcrR family transcriptional regulator